MAKPYMRHMDALPSIGERCDVLSPYEGWIPVTITGHKGEWAQFLLPDGQLAGAKQCRFRPLGDGGEALYDQAA